MAIDKLAQKVLDALPLKMKNIAVKLNDSIDVVNDINDGVFSEATAGAGIAVDGVLLKDGIVLAKPTAAAINSTDTATAAQIATGYITSTSAAAVAITTPTAAAIYAAVKGSVNSYFDFIIDNSAGSNTITLTLDATIAVVTPAVTGGATLTVSTANAVGIFRIVFVSAIAAKIFRIG